MERLLQSNASRMEIERRWEAGGCSTRALDLVIFRKPKFVPSLKSDWKLTILSDCHFLTHRHMLSTCS
jgi:hypothetical protein